MNLEGKNIFYLNGDNLTPDILQKLSRKEFFIDLDQETWKRVSDSAQVIMSIVRTHEKVYGITTGFGYFSDVLISCQQIKELQNNIIRSHSCGVGNPIPLEFVRMILVLRINVLAKGHSGLTVKTLQKFIQAYNDDLLPLIYEQGTVGASGDLAPLSHLCLGLIGEGKLYDFDKNEYAPAETVMEKKKYEKINLFAKEGLSLINGTQFLTAFLNEAYLRAYTLSLSAEVIFSLTLEILNGSFEPFNPKIFLSRQDSKEAEISKRILENLLDGKEISQLRRSFKQNNKVSDPISFMCFPQAHAQIYETLEMIKEILTNEMNAVTDNPLVFTKEDDPLIDVDHLILSGGNFHGEYIAKAADYLSMSIHDLALMSERRIERLVNPHLNENLPAFLAESGGLNSGFMIVQYTAASLVSENKHLSNPASIDTIPTSAEQEDHVSMGGWAVRKALKIVENAEKVLAIELFCACQALDLRKHKPSSKLQKVHENVRKLVPFLKNDEIMSDHIENLAIFLKGNNII